MSEDKRSRIDVNGKPLYPADGEPWTEEHFEAADELAALSDSGELVDFSFEMGGKTMRSTGYLKDFKRESVGGEPLPVDEDGHPYIIIGGDPWGDAAAISKGFAGLDVPASGFSFPEAELKRGYVDTDAGGFRSETDEEFAERVKSRRRPDLRQVRIETIDHPWEDSVKRQIYCPGCNLAADYTIARELVRREPDDEEPTAEQLASPHWRVLDAATGGPKRREQRRKAERLIADVDERLRRLLDDGGCPHGEAKR